MPFFFVWRFGSDLRIALGQMGIFVWDIQNESATPSDCQVIEGIPWIAVAFHSVCFLVMLLAHTPKFALVSPISPVLQARAEWAACVLTASESNNWQNVVINISGSYPAFQRFLIFLSHRQTIFVSFLDYNSGRSQERKKRLGRNQLLTSDKLRNVKLCLCITIFYFLFAFPLWILFIHWIYLIFCETLCCNTITFADGALAVVVDRVCKGKKQKLK